MHRPLLAAAALLLLVSAPAGAQPSFITFESGLVQPLALSPDGSRLFAVNAPDNRLEIFDLGPRGLENHRSVQVGMEPVAVAAESNDRVWVVNHLSDSVSIVDVPTLRVERTLLAGDEPRAIVFAGPGGNRAFITTAHRGQHRTDASIAAVPGAGDPQLTTAGIGRADVWVFDANALGATIGGTPLKIIELFGDTPRALAVSPDGNTVYAAVLNSGNLTTAVSEGAVCNGFGAGTCGIDGITSPGGLPGGVAPGGNPGPSTDHNFENAPEVGLIVKYDGAVWRDELGRNWNNGVRFSLPDKDVFAIDATTLNETSNFTGVGTTLFNMAVNPVNGNVYVSNTESINEVRFEGPGSFGGSTVQGHLAESRVTVLTGGSAKPRHLNRHIDYSILPAPAGTKDHSLATPVDMVVSSDGATLYVAAFGSSKVGVFSTADLENDALWDDIGAEFDPTVESANYVSVSGGGPAGLILDETMENGSPRNLLYVLTRFDNSISVVDVATGTETFHIPLYNPEPASVVEGRPFLYDAFETSSNGEASCASCHIFGDMDQLAWDLGNPDDEVTASPINVKLDVGAIGFSPPINGTGDINEFHPMKGPMTTQTLRGMVNHGAMHWRGDRSNGFFGVAAKDSDLAFRNFIVAFEGLVGRASMITGGDMQKFTDFALQITLPPNPIRALDNTLTANEFAGVEFFLGNDGADGFGLHRSDGVPVLDNAGFTCEGCHTLDEANGFFGGDGDQSFENETQIQKVPHLRNVYQKIGMFGMPDTGFFLGGDNGHKGDQIRGFGFLHDGSVDSIFRFLRAEVFEFQDFIGLTTVGFDDGPAGDVQRRNVEEFMLAFNSDLAPIVGQQVTLDSTNGGVVNPRINLLKAAAGIGFTSQILGPGAKQCDLVAVGKIFNETVSWVYRPGSGLFERDDGSMDTDLQVRLFANGPNSEVTYTCAPPGSGDRMGIDRDEDGVGDSVDNCPTVPNPGQANADADEHGDVCDNCMALANSNQCDADLDGYGSACDADYDGDGLTQITDFGPLSADFGQMGTTITDNNCDGITQIADFGVLSAFFGQPPGPSGLACQGGTNCTTP